jgi:hypothetical protein
MSQMFRPISAAMALTIVCATSFSLAARADQASPHPSPAATQPPEIYHVITRPLCTALRKRIGPSIGMILQNDRTISKGPQLFKDYNFAYGNKEEGARNIALLRMENLVGPLANNIIAIKKQLDDPELFPAVPQNDDQVKALKMKDQLLKAVATQEAALDVINGFVQTQQMGDLQHADEALIKSISDNGEIRGQQSALQTPDPLYHQSDYAGIAPDKYSIDPATLPGLTLGYNPVTRLHDALTWTQDETKSREDTAAVSVTNAAHECGAGAAATPSPKR